MRTVVSLGFVALLGAASSTAGCASDDDATPSAAGASGMTSSGGGGTGGGTGSGGANGATGGADTASGGTSNGDAGTSSADAGTSSGDGGTSSTDGGTSNGDAGTSSTDAGASGNDTNAGAGGAIDVEPYANVVKVTTSGTEGNYTFNVSVESSDVDCTQYANWWEVLTEDGALSYRRIIDHSHTDENGTSDPDKPGNTYTRNGGPVPVTADTVVLVRSHMSTGGYNGMVMRGTAAGDFVQAPDIGGDFAPDVELLEPQPTSCAF